MTTPVILGIASIFIGFFLFTLSFLTYMGKKKPALTWALFGIACIFLTVVPVTLAVFWATTPAV